MSVSQRKNGLRCRWIIIAVILTQIVGGAAFAQDRPLLEPLRIGYPQSSSLGDRLRMSGSLVSALRRKGFLTDWHVLSGGLDVVRSLDAGELDVALDISLGDVVAAKRANLKMVFISELRSIAPTCCELEQHFADHILKRYTLSSEYLADQRLLILHRETAQVLRGTAQEQASAGRRAAPTAATFYDRQDLVPANPASLITRETMRQANDIIAGRMPGVASVDLTDVNYWARAYD